MDGEARGAGIGALVARSDIKHEEWWLVIPSECVVDLGLNVPAILGTGKGPHETRERRSTRTGHHIRPVSSLEE
jgi:hypothetical protein